MAEAPDPAPPTAPKPPPDPVVAQRALIYSLAGFIAVSGIVLAAAFTGRMPGALTIVAMLGVFAANVLAYELRWWIRVWLPAVLGVMFLVLSASSLAAGRPIPLVVAQAVFGAGMIACSYGMKKDRREGWAFAVSMFGIVFIAHFFGTSVLRSAFGVHLAVAVLPALAVFLPAFIALACSPPGAKRYAPFATKPLG